MYMDCPLTIAYYLCRLPIAYCVLPIDLLLWLVIHKTTRQIPSIFETKSKILNETQPSCRKQSPEMLHKNQIY